MLQAQAMVDAALPVPPAGVYLFLCGCVRVSMHIIHYASARSPSHHQPQPLISVMSFHITADPFFSLFCLFAVALAVFEKRQELNRRLQVQRSTASEILQLIYTDALSISAGTR